MLYKVVAIFVILFLSSTLAISQKVQTQTAFIDFMHKFGKSYNHDEFQGKFNNFKKNLAFVESHNKRKDVTFKVGMNQFGDLSNTEFAAMYNGVRVPKGYKHDTTFVHNNVALPASFDWRDKGAVTAVKDQGQCGSCWSFSTTGSVEGCHFLTAGALVGLSEQNLVDCSTAQGNQGCNGGLMTQAMDYIIATGIDSESSYPYTATGPNNCQFSASNIASHESSYNNIASGDENALQQAVSQGPTSVAIDASQSSFQFYTSGVYSDPNCSSSQLDHGVLAVGWGSTGGQDYWIVKNSWNTSWGNQGYIWMARNDNNMCGIATMATIPKSCSN
jgi:cathepsin L